MKHLLTFLCFGLTTACILPAQAPSIEWAKSYGSSMNEYCYTMECDPNGGYIMGGTTDTETNDGDVTGPHSMNDIWLVKTSSTGVIVWEKCLGGTNMDLTTGLAMDTDSGYIVSGYTASNDGDVTLNHGNYDGWLIKLNKSGSVIWKKCFGGTSNDYFQAVQPCPDGGYIAVGSTISNDGDVSGNHGGRDLWLVKANSAGVMEWQKCFGGPSGEFGFKVYLTPDHGFIISGIAMANGGDVTGNHGGIDAWVIKTDSVGTLEWQRCYGGSQDEHDILMMGALSIDVFPTPDHGYWLATLTKSTDGDVTGNHGDYDAWVAKLDSSGNIIWQKCLGGSSDDRSVSIRPTMDGGCVVAGLSNSTNGDVSGNHGAKDYWVVKLDAGGSIQWSKSLGGYADESAYGIRTTDDGGCIVAGTARSNDGDVIDAKGRYDFWAVKLSPTTGLDVSQSINTCQVYPNPASGYLIVEGTIPGSKILMYDAIGQISGVFYAGSEPVLIDLEGKLPGMYMLVTSSTDGKIETYSCIVQ